jgi:hypothetical protein
MMSIYNTILQLANKRRDDVWAYAGQPAPISMPRHDDLIAAVERASRSEWIADVSHDATLLRSIQRIHVVDQLVREHASRRAAKGRQSKIALDEMPCPECEHGTLCYIMNPERGTFVECSTVGCLYWDELSQ